MALAAPASMPRASGDLAAAILRTIAYADVFDHPLEPREVRRWLVGLRASEADVEGALAGDPRIESSEGLVHLRERGEIVELRRRRAEASARLWPTAHRWAALVARLPFVRGVAVTGALAMDNAEGDGDIDLFVLARPRRVWTCRLFVVAVVRAAALRSVRLCPNFVLSTDHLGLACRDLFTAHEVAQARWVAGTPWVDAFLEANAWSHDLLPNAQPASLPRRSAGALTRAAEAALASRAFDALERWEMRRKIHRLEERRRREGGSARFNEHECRGHFAAHDERVREAFARRCVQLGVAT